MSDTVTQLPLRQRNPWLAYLLAIVTLGVYWLVWYYQLNRELAEMGRRVDPAGAVVAMFPGSMIVVPPFVSVYNTGERVRVSERDAGIDTNLQASPGIGLLLHLVAGLSIVYYQMHLNLIINHSEVQPATA